MPKNIFKDIVNTIQTNEKKRLIKSSGSIKGNNYEKVRSGQSYLYKKYGMESEVIEVKLKQGVWGSSLSEALSKTMVRYPYFNTKLVELNGDFYIIKNDTSLTARKTKKLAKLGGIAIQHHLIDITYYGKSIYISFHHALCDGRGIKAFIETLIYYYCKTQYRNNDKIEGIRLSTDKLLEGESVDPFLKEYEYDQTKQFPTISRDAFAIPENVHIDEKLNYRYELEIPSVEFMKVCKQNNATPVILLTLLMSKGITQLYPNYDKPINSNIATDIREQLGMPNTFKNCVKSMILPYSREFDSLPLKEQATQYRELLKQQRDTDYCRKEANTMLGLFNKLDSLNSYEEKQKIMAFFDDMTLNTYIISYLGQFTLGSNSKYIDSIHLYNSGTSGLGINMIATSDKFILDFKQNFKSDKYIKAFVEQLNLLDIPCKQSSVIEFLTPEDSLIKRKHK